MGMPARPASRIGRPKPSSALGNSKQVRHAVEVRNNFVREAAAGGLRQEHCCLLQIEIASQRQQPLQVFSVCWIVGPHGARHKQPGIRKASAQNSTGS